MGDGHGDVGRDGDVLEVEQRVYSRRVVEDLADRTRATEC